MSFRVRSSGRSLAAEPPRGFSLIELMVAIVILGLGLVMVATVFPIAWGRARQLSEVTTQVSITEGAKTAIGLLTRVDGLGYNAASFVGDLVYCEEDTAHGIPNSIVMYSDTRVHFLHMENLLVSPRAFVPSRLNPWLEDPGTDWSDSYSPWQLERKPLLGAFNPAATVCAWHPDVFACRDTFLSPQVRFEQRVHPPIRRPRAADSVDLTGLFNGQDDEWDELLSTRRYAWAIFHRMPEPCMGQIVEDGVTYTGPDEWQVYSADIARKLAENAMESCTHDFEVYYTMLRRPRSTLRFARQDPATSRCWAWCARTRCASRRCRCRANSARSFAGPTGSPRTTATCLRRWRFQGRRLLHRRLGDL